MERYNIYSQNIYFENLIFDGQGYDMYPTGGSGLSKNRGEYMMMPQMDGWQTIQELQKIVDLPIIILSVLNQTESIVRALELGADDYITKPFDTSEVIARVESVLRRAIGKSRVSRLSIDSIGLILDLDTHEVFYADKCFQLTGKMFDVM